MSVKMVLRPSLDDHVIEAILGLDVDVVVPESDDEAVAAIGDADCFYGRITPALLQAGRNLRWIQATSAGLDNYFFSELRSSDVVMTNLRGIYSDVIADHVFAFVLMFARGMHVYHAHRLEGRWQKGAPVIHLGGTTVGVIGLGGIGLEVCKRAHAFDMRVVGVDPAPKDEPDYVEKIYDPSGLEDMLKTSDFVVICVPHTGETEYMMDERAIFQMKRGAVLVNIGRGKVVDLSSLADALEAQHLQGAALDVFEEEPLPADHRLWSMEQCLITPHVAGTSPQIQSRRESVIIENVRRFCSGDPLLNVVDKPKGYVVERNPS